MFEYGCICNLWSCVVTVCRLLCLFYKIKHMFYTSKLVYIGVYHVYIHMNMFGMVLIVSYFYIINLLTSVYFIMLVVCLIYYTYFVGLLFYIFFSFSSYKQNIFCVILRKKGLFDVAVYFSFPLFSHSHYCLL